MTIDQTEHQNVIIFLELKKLAEKNNLTLDPLWNDEKQIHLWGLKDTTNEKDVFSFIGATLNEIHSFLLGVQLEKNRSKIDVNPLTSEVDVFSEE